MDMGQVDIDQMETSADTVDFMSGAKDIDIAYELMLRQRDVPLSSKIEQIFGGGGIQELIIMRIVIWFVLRQKLQMN